MSHGPHRSLTPSLVTGVVRPFVPRAAAGFLPGPARLCRSLCGGGGSVGFLRGAP